MTEDEKETLCIALAQRLTDDADLDTLMDYFFDKQVEYFMGLNKKDLDEQAELILQ